MAGFFIKEYKSRVFRFFPRISWILRTDPISVGPPAADNALNAEFRAEIVNPPVILVSPKTFTKIVRAVAMVNAN